MLEYNDRKIFVDDKEYDFRGINTSHILWHLQELYKPSKFIDNLNETYTMPSNIGYMSLAEGETFDALLIDNKMFRFNKLNESDLEEIQDYINKYAYATALVKINECSNIIGCGLNHDYTIDESYSFISKCYDKLFENAYISNEKGRLVESFGSNNKVNIYEGENNYIRGIGNSRVVENWQNPFKFENISRYLLEDVEQDGNNVKLGFIDNKGVKMTAIFENTDSKLINAGINLKHLLNKNNLVESYRTGTLLEYHQPFTLKAASLLSYEEENGLLKLTLKDAFGNKGDVFAKLNIPVEDFIKKYKRDMDEIISEPYASDNIRETSNFLGDASDSIESLSRVKNLSSDGDDPVLSYKVAAFTPVKSENGEVVSRKRDDRNKFVVAVLDDEGTPYNLVYSYRGSDINADIEELNNMADEFEFDDPSDVYSFYSILDDYGNIERSAKRGISTKDRNYARNVKEEEDIMEGEGVQVNDIAPKLDQNVGTIQVKMKKRKSRKVENDIVNFNKSDLLISKINEQDEFYGARGFIKDEKGRYHFGDYYINESGKVVHKSKLNEFVYYCDGCGGKYDDDYDLATYIGDKCYCPDCAEENKPDEKQLKRLHDLSKMYDVDRNTVEKYYHFPKDLQNIKKHGGAGKYNENEWKDLFEGKEEADEAYYRVNDATLKLKEVKPFIKAGTDAEKIYTDIIIALNNLQMELHNSLLNEDMSRGELIERVKQGVIEGLNKCKTASDLEDVLNYYLSFVKDYDFNSLKENGVE